MEYSRRRGTVRVESDRVSIDLFCMFYELYEYLEKYWPVDMQPVARGVIAEPGKETLNQLENPMNDRRIRVKGRRDYEQSLECFFWDSGNRLNTNDRRRIPDRRTGSIEVDWIEERLNL